MASSRTSAIHRNASSRAQMSSAATAAFNEEQIAQAFLERLKITAENDEVANGLLERFTGFFRDMHEGRRAAPLTKLIVANVLIDEEPTMVDEYLELFDKCCNTFAWAGKLSPPPEDLAMITPSAGTGLDAQPSAAGLPSQLQPSASGIEDISTAAEAQEVGTVSGSTSARRGNRTGSSRPTHGKREWLAMAKRLVPEGRGSYALWFTSCNIAIIISVFAYMAGDYAMWVKENRGSFLADESIPANTDTYAEELLLDAARVPQYLKSWLSWTATWQTFSFEFLKAWGGRWAPGLQRGNDGNGAWWLWVTSIYIHQNLQHIVSNLLLFIAMSVHLELNYGWWRLLLVWFTSGIGANLVSAAFEKSCTLLVGASGAVFGFMGLFVADLVINFESISWPFLRILIILLFVIFFVVNAIIDDSPQRVSHASHLGGLVCGLFPSLLFLPNLRNKRLKALQRQITEGGGPAEGATTNTRQNIQDELERELRASFWTRNFLINPLFVLACIVIVVIYVILPIYLYRERLPGACCQPDLGTSLACDSLDDPDAGDEEPDGGGRRLLEQGEAWVDPWGSKVVLG